MPSVIRSLPAVVLACCVGGASAATFVASEYSVDYDELTAYGNLSFSGGGGGGFRSFGWSSPDGLGVSAFSGGSSADDFVTSQLPSFTLAAASGYQITGLSITYGGTRVLVANPGDGNEANLQVVLDGTATVGGSPQYSGANLNFAVTGGETQNANWTISSPFGPAGPYASISFSDGVVTMEANAFGSAFSGATAVVNRGPEVQFYVTAVPEPHEWAMMLSGLGLVGWMARRRRADAAPGPTALPA